MRKTQKIQKINEFFVLGDVINKNILHIKDKGFNVSVKYAPNNVKEFCYADKRNSAVINYNGDIYKCTARDFKRENRLGYITEEGQLIWENNSLENRMNSKFKNKPCLLCSILPICNGGCTQHALEHLQIKELNKFNHIFKERKILSVL